MRRISPLIWFVLLFGLWSHPVYSSCIRYSPNVTVNPAALDFGSVNVGSSTTLSFTVTYVSGYYAVPAFLGGGCCNCSNPTGVFATVSSSSGNFTVNQSYVEMPDGASRTVSVTFQPASEGTFTANITLRPSSGSVQTVSLVGVGYQPRAILNLNATNFDFGNVQVNAGRTQTLVVSNSGDATLTGTLSTSSPFSISPGSFSIAPGGSQSFSVGFTAGARGATSGGLTIGSNDPNASSMLLSLAGNGVAPDLTISPTSQIFGSIPLGESETRAVTISNSSGTYSATLHLSSFQISGAGFSFSGPGVTSLEPGQSTTVQIAFSPSSNGYRSGGLSLSSDDPWHSASSVSLGGTGVSPAINPSTLNLSFGSVHLGRQNSIVLNLANNGSSFLSINGFSFTSTYSATTISVSPGSARLAPGASQNFTVTFAPTFTGTLGGYLNVYSNDPQLPTMPVVLAGEGITPQISTDSLLDFQNVYINPSHPSEAGTLDLNVTVANGGNESLSVTNVRSSDPAFIPLGTTLTVPAGSQATLPVRYRPTSTGDQTGTLTITSNDYYRPSTSVTLRGTGVSYLDLNITGVEVTQTIQKMDNSLPLVAGKKTVVRTYIDMSLWGDNTQKDTVRNVDGLLHIFRGGQEIAGSPLNSMNGPIDAVPNPDRSLAGQTLNFLIPPSLTDCGDCPDGGGQLDLQVVINPASGGRVGRIMENNYENNVMSQSSYFWKNYEPLFYYIPISLTYQNGVPRFPLPPDPLMLEATALFKKIYPLSNISYVRRPVLATRLDPGNNSDSLLAALFLASHLGNVPPPDRTYGWWPVNYQTSFGGIAEDIPGRVAMGGSLDNMNWAKSTFAHEIGHTYGLCHSHQPATIDCHYPGGTYTDGHVVSDGAVEQVGFDIESLQTVSPLSLTTYLNCMDDSSHCTDSGRAIDFMSYGPSYYPRWISPQRYQFLFSKLRSALTDPSNARGCGNLSDCTAAMTPTLLIAGSISPNDSVTIQPIYAAPSIPDEASSGEDESNYSLKVLDKDGIPVFEYPLHPTFGFHGFQGTSEKDFVFSVVVPDQEGIDKIQITHDDAVLAEKSKTNHPPAVTLLSPQGGDIVQGVLTVQWQATDEDGDSLTYSVLYSIDGGETFQAIGIDLHDTTFQYDASRLGGSTSAVVRVVATDGFNTTTVDSPSFLVTSKPPDLTILSPKDGLTIFSGSVTSLEANAVDPEDGTLPATSVHWSSDLSGDLGSSNPLDVTLSLGTHTLTATATDSDGNSTSQHVQVYVVNGAEAPRASAGENQTVDEGETVALDASATTDPNEGDTLTYEWKQTAGPTVSLDDPNAIKPIFTAPQVTADTSLTFQVTVTDQTGNVGTSSVDVTVLNVFYPSLKISSTELDFGTVTIGSSATRTFQVSNEGNEALEITDITPSRSVFSANPNSLSLVPGSAATVTVTFAPNEAASYEGTLQVISNSVTGVASVIVLKGTAPAPEVIHNDNGAGGSLLPQSLSTEPPPAPPPVTSLPAPAASEPPPADSNDASPKLPDTSGNPPPPTVDGSPTESTPGSFEFHGIGGCSLIP